LKKNPPIGGFFFVLFYLGIELKPATKGTNHIVTTGFTPWCIKRGNADDADLADKKG